MQGNMRNYAAESRMEYSFGKGILLIEMIGRRGAIWERKASSTRERRIRRSE